ncbi:MAG: hypothetical protein LJE69_10150 [Thiohalocapsa sp.]|jgi:hypothetical protein|uniref:hypothetical protein n=1 Tax=Thiohalocapsa sp. TaxID=2497641 RepID=UPI002600860E|nr:hypothetical protein [Thiohalocapsa sp.]MCG6941599.1 hypothetical protein [Thiohalocapsa sp.]
MSGDTAACSEHDPPIAQAVASLSAEFIQRQLPRALGIQVQVADGEALSDEDVAFLMEMVDTLGCAGELLGHDPRLEAMHRCALSLYDDILTEAFVQAMSEIDAGVGAQAGSRSRDCDHHDAWAS